MSETQEVKSKGENRARQEFQCNWKPDAVFSTMEGVWECSSHTTHPQKAILTDHNNHHITRTWKHLEVQR